MAQGRFNDLTDQRFGRLKVLYRASPKGAKNTKWACVCDCTKETVVAYTSLVRGEATSCGCYRDEVHRTHGMSRTPIYGLYRKMLDRCSNPKSVDYAFYGGRGITVCDRWNPEQGGCFENFYADMGPRPEGTYPSGWPLYSLDRTDNDGPYSPENCQWADKEQQTKNVRPRRVSLRGDEIHALAADLLSFGGQQEFSRRLEVALAR